MLPVSSAPIDDAVFQQMQGISAFTLRLGMNPNDSCISSVLTWFFYMGTDSQKDHLPSLVGNSTVAARDDRYKRQKHTSGEVTKDFDVRGKSGSLFVCNKYVEKFTISEGFGEIVDGDRLAGLEDCIKFSQKVLAKNAANVEIIVMIYTANGNHTLGFFHSKRGNNFLFDPNVGQYAFANAKIAEMMTFVARFYSGTVAIFCQWLPS